MNTSEYLEAQEKQLQLDRATLRADREALDAKRELLKTEAVALVSIERDRFKKDLETFEIDKLRLEETKKKLEEDAKAWSALRQTAATMAGDARVALDVGGTVFWTTKTTLARIPVSFFSALLQWPSVPEGGYFIDRDPRYIGDILNVMRGLPVSKYLAYLPEFIEEMKFYSLQAESEQPSPASEEAVAVNILVEIAKTHDIYERCCNQLVAAGVVDIAVSSQHDPQIRSCRLIDYCTGRSIRSAATSTGAQWVSLKICTHAATVTHYSFVCQRNGESDSNMMRNWDLEASTDGMGWVTLRRHTDDMSIGQDGLSDASWPVNSKGIYYTHFRIITTGFQSSCSTQGKWPLNVGRLKLYGHIRAIEGSAKRKRVVVDEEDE